MARPNKPTDLDETLWGTTVRDEIATIHPRLVLPGTAVPVEAGDLQAVDLELLAAQAVLDADERSTSTGGRFSVVDLCAGASRAISRTGLVAERTIGCGTAALLRA
ncbi:hypothetical protein ABC195_16290 [Microbacterium sp. 2P01SA-2]|uniref:hypothetical protein n=1 Tax=unclassified Microbacterium TaxID=2609290 RepID=UPI0039A146C1